MGQDADIAKSGTPLASGAAAQGGVLSKVPTVLHAVTVQSVTAQYILLFDATAVPANTDTSAIEVIKVAAAGTVHLTYPKGKVFFKGVAWSTSSTAPALTAGGSDGYCCATGDLKRV